MSHEKDIISLTAMRSILDASHEIIALLDKNGSLIEFNRALEVRLNKSREKLIESCIWVYFPAEISKNRKLLTEQVFKTAKVAHLEDYWNGKWSSPMRLFRFLDWTHPAMSPVLKIIRN
jgi:PAS domain-containing protein